MLTNMNIAALCPTNNLDLSNKTLPAPERFRESMSDREEQTLMQMMTKKDFLPVSKEEQDVLGKIPAGVIDQSPLSSHEHKLLF